MITSENVKYLSKDYAEKREECARDKTQFTASEQAFYEVTSTPSDGDGDLENEMFLVDNTPIDGLTEPRTIDLRKVHDGILYNE
jgi:hypothetical protein